MSDRIHVLIADDHAIVRQGLKQILSETEDLVVAGEADVLWPRIVQNNGGGTREEPLALMAIHAAHGHYRWGPPLPRANLSGGRGRRSG